MQVLMVQGTLSSMMTCDCRKIRKIDCHPMRIFKGNVLPLRR